MPRVIHFEIHADDTERAVAFYRTLFGQEPTKTRSRYAKFEVAEPPINLALNEVGGETGPNNPVAHFGIQLKSTEAVRTVAERLAKAGWSGGEAITDSQLMVDYYRTTRDGRIAFGKGTGAIAYGSRIGPVFSEDAASLQLTEAYLRRTYPQLGDVGLTHRWSGPIDRTYDSLPIFGRLGGQANIHYGIGWSGNGVGPSRLGGRILQEWRPRFTARRARH